MPGRVILSLAIHNHQPVGNFPQVFETAFRQAYLPMVEALERHPRIRLAMHYSGPLLDWLDESQREFLPRLRALVTRGQVELMTGGYYEPILAIIPDADKDGQIQMMTDYLRRRFHARATGFWLAERVWEPHLAKPLAAAGAEYLIVDDTHFLAVGLREEQLTGYFVTEEQGATVKVFPSRKRLRYLIPWRSADEVLAYLRTFLSPDPGLPRAESRGSRIPDPVLVMGDDGEKFGLWPGTFALCWEQGWVESFFGAIEAAGEWLVTMPPGDAAAMPAAGRVYLPTASYEEMMEWSGGFWRQFLVKYPEINTMYQRMLRTSRKVHALRAGPRRGRALVDLWAGQCNCPYWHGVFGGIYLPHIRRATFGHLIAAQVRADEARRVAGTIADLDGDGALDVELVSPAMLLAVDPDEGGGVVEWHWRAEQINLTNVVSRRPEAYHRQLLQHPSEKEAPGVETIHTTRVRVKEPGLHRLLVYDRYRHAGFLDHFFDPQVTMEAFARGEYQELGDFVAGSYRPAVSRSRDGVAVSLTRDGSIGREQRLPLRVEKRLALDVRRPALRATYRIHNPGDAQVSARFGVETAWAVTDPQARLWIDDQAAGAREARARPGARVVRFTDWGWRGAVSLRFPEAGVWVFPLETVSNSEAGFERIVQGVVCLCVWQIGLDPQRTWEATLECELG